MLTLQSVQQSVAQLFTSVAATGDAEALASALASAEAAGCPQAELEAAKAELKALQRRDCLAVVLRGATGPYADLVNGTYAPTDEKVNGKTVYIMTGNTDRCLFMATSGVYFAASMTEKKENRLKGFAFTAEVGLAHPMLAKKWMVDGGEAWLEQPLSMSLVSVREMLSSHTPPFPPANDSYSMNAEVWLSADQHFLLFLGM